MSHSQSGSATRSLTSTPSRYLGLFAVALAWTGGCSSEANPPSPETLSAASSPPSIDAATTASTAAHQVASASPAQRPLEPRGSAERGRKLVEKHECQRCHDGLSELKSIVNERHCTHCHQDVMKGRFQHKKDNVRWQHNVEQLTLVPSLEGLGKRYRYGWLVSYLLDPNDLRPNLQPTMIRLPLSRSDARDIATYLTREAPQVSPKAAPAPDAAIIERGRKLLTDRGCGSCHHFSGNAILSEAPKRERETSPALMLAPDLRFTRDRMDGETLVRWLLDPQAMKPKTLMPKLALSEDEGQAMAAFILHAPLEPLPQSAPPALPKPLTRKVSYDEVAKRIFSKTCGHCHGNPDIARGDGGPGNSGGFGFRGIGLELTSYTRVMAGYLDASGERHSIFEPMADGTPRLLASLLARHAEEAGKPNPQVRGMPLGLPALPMEDIQLLVTWIAQGRPR